MAVSWGLESKELLLSENPDFIVNEAKELSVLF